MSIVPVSERLCTIDGCTRKFWARGWCSTHYRRWRKTGSVADPAPCVPKPCSIDGCPHDADSRGWCKSHYARWRRSGSVEESQLVKAKSPVVDGKKQCGMCEQWLAVSSFNKHRHGSGGIESACRSCQRLRNVAWRERNPTYFQEWQKANPEKVRAAVHNRRAKMYGREFENIDNNLVFERDGFMCMLCNQPLDMSAVFPHPLFPTIDHVVSLNRGGFHKYDNIQSAHFYCNTSKGDRDAPLSFPVVA